ncbi:hypothetical protein Nepgr_030932 [Nepenthes gracilis]|uniref:Uncharacterized protein n=1 Tax=Nepenthes gracilis TaxID=150966 RepID=A0AAD3THB7_NEPGR|nr:hypothetical protein Nepgr_030932 [Nepenthes gracilis]
MLDGNSAGLHHNATKCRYGVCFADMEFLLDRWMLNGCVCLVRYPPVVDQFAKPWVTLAAGEVWKACYVFPLSRMTRLEAVDEAWKVCFDFPGNQLT